MSTLIFAHIHKTGGISIAESLTRLFDPEQVLNHFNYGALTELSRFGFIATHEKFSDLLDLDIDDKIFITSVRRPVDRLVSLYRFWHSVSREEAIKTGSNFLLEVKRCSLAEFITSQAPDLQHYLDNEMTRYLSNAGDIVCEDDFQLACENLAKMSSILVLENLEDDMSRFFDQLGWSSKLRTVKRLNVTDENPSHHPEKFDSAAKVSIGDLSDDVVDSLMSRTYFDRRLYDYAIGLREEKKHKPIAGAEKLPFRRVAISKGETIVPSASEAYALILGASWARDHEPQFSVNKCAFLYFKVAGGTDHPTVAEVMFSVLLIPNRDFMIVDIRADSGPWQSFLFLNQTQIDIRQPAFADVTAICSGTTAKASLPLEMSAENFVHAVEFKHSGASSPEFLAFNHDNRKIAVKFESLHIV